jgi:hypothetical protein
MRRANIVTHEALESLAIRLQTRRICISGGQVEEKPGRNSVLTRNLFHGEAL